MVEKDIPFFYSACKSWRFLAFGHDELVMKAFESFQLLRKGTMMGLSYKLWKKQRISLIDNVISKTLCILIMGKHYANCSYTVQFVESIWMSSLAVGMGWMESFPYV